MTTPTLTYTELRALKPCSESLTRIARLMGGASKWNGKKITAKQARKAGATLEDIAWAASAIAQSNPDIERRLRLWLADCAAHVLYIYEKESDDNRPRNAITITRQFARGKIDGTAWAAARAAARAAASAAAWDAAQAAASDAAWAAAWAAARAAAGDAARDAAGAAAGAAASDAAWAAASDAAWDAAGAAAGAAAWAAARAAEQEWQFDRLILWLGANEPEDHPLPERGTK
jgi:hypothetical protein